MKPENPAVARPRAGHHAQRVGQPCPVQLADQDKACVLELAYVSQCLAGACTISTFNWLEPLLHNTGIS